MSNTQAKLNVAPEYKDIFTKLAWDNGTTPPQLLKTVIQALVDYVEREGEMPTPFALVPKREMQAFQRWQQSQGLKSVDSTDTQAEETA